MYCITSQRKKTFLIYVVIAGATLFLPITLAIMSSSFVEGTIDEQDCKALPITSLATINFACTRYSLWDKYYDTLYFYRPSSSFIMYFIYSERTVLKPERAEQLFPLYKPSIGVTRNSANHFSFSSVQYQKLYGVVQASARGS